LYENVHEIKLRSAKANEAMIQILNEKQKVDFAKARLLSSSTSSLTEIITLECIYAQLEAEVRIGKRCDRLSTTIISSHLSHLLFSQTKSIPQDYLKLADLLKRMKESFAKVESFVLVEKVAEVQQKYNALVGTLKRKLLKSFREIGQVYDFLLLPRPLSSS
jgi:hypothetical protein